MKKALKRIGAALLLAAVLLAGLAGCGAPAAGPSASAPNAGGPSASAPGAGEKEPVTMLLAAAASLEDSFANTLIPLFCKEYPWVTVEGTYASSGKLQTQIEEGLQASVFMSAAEKQMDALVGAGLVDESTVVPLLKNEIVLIAPIDSDTDIDSFARITEASTIALGDPASVPAGQYAQEALTSLGVWEEIEGRASFAADVTEVLNQVAAGSAEVGVVYATDAAQMPDKVKVLATAPAGSLAADVVYPIGILANAPQREAAELFVVFLRSDAAMAVFIENGFTQNTQVIPAV